MSIAKSISEEQKALIQSWADEGLGLPEVQRRLADEMEIKVTYMETRFLIDDLGIKLPEVEKPEPPEEPEEPEAAADSEDTAEAALADDEKKEPADSGSVSVTISELVRPGAMVSGTVTFAGGEAADWWMDQMGRLGMDARNREFRPSESDLMAFQKELQEVARKKGL